MWRRLPLRLFTKRREHDQKPAFSEPCRSTEGPKPSHGRSSLRNSQSSHLSSAVGARWCCHLPRPMRSALQEPSSARSPAGVETSSRAATANGSVVHASLEPLPRETRPFSPYLAAPGEAASAQSRAQARPSPEAGRGPGALPSRRAQARPMHTSAWRPPAPGPGLQRRGRQARRIPAINHNAFRN